MIRLAIRVRREHAELVLAELLELAPHGVEEVDLDTGAVEYAIYGAPGELPELPRLRAAAGDALVDVQSTEVADDWADRWRDFHRPLVLGKRLSVRPPWEPPQGTELDLVIDPGRAFGTGSHATTRLCLELLLGLGSPPAPRAASPAVVDLGCGSGVLGIAAAKLGWGSVVALDHDQLAVDATIENAAVNGVAELIQARRFDLREQSLPQPPPELVLANLLGPLLLRWCERLADGGDAGLPGTVIASGLLLTEAERIAGAFADLGYAERTRRAGGEWAALLMDAPHHG